MMKLRISDAARQDLVEISEYTERVWAPSRGKSTSTRYATGCSTSAPIQRKAHLAMTSDQGFAACRAAAT
jgi:hypothetical protein